VSSLGQRIREARLRAGWSQNELASRADVKQPTLARIESGRRLDPSIRTVSALAGALDVSIESLVGRSEPSPSYAPSGYAAFDALEELTRHVAEVEARLGRRIAELESVVHRRDLRRA
jgi:transcriptional regulator with XRE-family HTH domain